MDKIYQAQFAAIKKNPIIINIVKTNFSKFSLSPIIKSLDLFFFKIPVSKVTIIWKGIFILKNFIKLRNNLFKIDLNWIKLIINKKVITFSKGFKKDFSFIGIQLKGYTNYSIII